MFHGLVYCGSSFTLLRMLGISEQYILIQERAKLIIPKYAIYIQWHTFQRSIYATILETQNRKLGSAVNLLMHS